MFNAYCQLKARNMACQNSRAKVPVPGNYFSSILGISIQFHLCYFFFTLVSTGWGISLRTVGVASKPVKPHLLSFAGFFIYVKRRFVANLKVIDSLMCKKWIFHFYSAMYITCNLVFILESPKAIERSWWSLQEIYFIAFKRFILKQFFTKINHFWINPWPQRSL